MRGQRDDAWVALGLGINIDLQPAKSRREEPSDLEGRSICLAELGAFTGDGPFQGGDLVVVQVETEFAVDGAHETPALRQLVQQRRRDRDIFLGIADADADHQPLCRLLGAQGVVIGSQVSENQQLEQALGQFSTCLDRK